MSATVLVCGLLIVVGLFGIVVPALPGTLLVGLGIAVWAAEAASAQAWVVFAIAATCLVVGAVVKYAVPGRRLRAAVPTSTLLAGGVGAVVGFFVIPVVGALVGFPVGVYAAERLRGDSATAWTSTKQALGAVGLSILVELAAAVVATGVWIVGLAVT